MGPLATSSWLGTQMGASIASAHKQERNFCATVCVYYCRTYDKAVLGGGRRRVEDMSYERRRAEACVDESAYQIQGGEVCVFITAGPITKLFAGGRHVL